MIRFRGFSRQSCASAALVTLLALGRSVPAASQSLPSHVSDATFWRLVTDFSEPGGAFQSENFLSNESEYQTVIPEVLRTTRPGGVYLGVGPEQNFTYIAALHPKIAFIVDIRRQALLQQLIYKAVFELARTRADFLSLLFGRTRARHLDRHSTPDLLFAAYEGVAADSIRSAQNATIIISWLTHHHRFVLDAHDIDAIRYVYKIISREGPFLFYASSESRPRNSRVTESTAWFPDRIIGADYASYMTTTDKGMFADGTGGVQRSYLATEENFLAVRALQRRNMIIPLVGDFAGPTTLRSVGQFLKDHRAVVTAFYTSNVESYLFKREGVWQQFYANVLTLPIDSHSTFIRWLPPSTELGSMGDLLAAFAAGRITAYANLREFSHR